MIVDVLRFSSAVGAAVERGTSVRVAEWVADAVDAHSLSPLSFNDVSPGAEVLLRSPNGARCTLAAAGAVAVYAGALVNASAVADAVSRVLERLPDAGVTVVAAGERWAEPADEGTLRFAIEDYLGAGAILSRITLSKSPEAEVCARVFEASRGELEALLLECGSGRELRERGWEAEVRHCAQLDSSDAVLRGGVYVLDRMTP